MITHYALSGFKSFRRESSFRLAPITLIYGGNSSGKSTIVQSIMLLKQTLEASGSTTSPLIFGSKKYVDLGTFFNVVSDHASTGSIRISLSVSPLDVQVRRASRAFREALENIRFELTVVSDLVGAPSLAEIALYSDDGILARYGPSTLPISHEEMRRLVQRSHVSRLQGLRASNATGFDLIEVNGEHPLLKIAFSEYCERLPRIRETLSPKLAGRPYFLDALFSGETEEEAVTSPEARRQTLERAIEERRSELKNYTYETFLEDVRAYNNDKTLVVNRFLPVVLFPRPRGTTRGGLQLDQRAEFEARRGADYPQYDLGVMFLTIANSIASELSEMAYIGPLRDYPERHYIYSGPTDETVGSRGENFPALLYAQERRRAELNKLGKLIGLEYSLDIFKSRDSQLNNVFALQLTDDTTGATVGLSDVGFGVSQVLPILMQCTAGSDATLVMEQPEIHLNPKLQADLGQVFAKAVDGTGRQLIVETHSEHLLLRIQRLIREGMLKPDQVAVLYVSKHREGSSVLEIPLAENGDRLIDWPDGFFDDTYRELFDVAPLR